MGSETKRYRVRPKTYLCLSPEEALHAGISVGEETLEELALVQTSGFGYPMYAAVSSLPEQKLGSMPVEERKEKLFENRRDALRYIKQHPPGYLNLFGVKDTRTVDRSEITLQDEQPLEDIASELKSFGR